MIDELVAARDGLDAVIAGAVPVDAGYATC
jgi:hypothetical protein